ncbi:neural proliferation differentiation and control protein 1-like isoform X3 [Hyla sarda]|uniref:neural proliferation differentiation and control protein 1-like isoform X3 n=1 Tax=Hyla sarda TaxID=327740 RepID=UPI0024C3CB6B|nr:neural proliferation differentiation and control protein 1-like isoform X3 [Hyla sarda]
MDSPQRLILPTGRYTLQHRWPGPAHPNFPPRGVNSRCLSNLDCVMKNREMCPPGSQQCGPCVPNFEESKFGTCKLKVSRRLTFRDPDSVIDFIQEYRMSKGQRIIPTAAVPTTMTTMTTTTTAPAASPHLPSTEDKPKLLQSSSAAHAPSLLNSTFPPQMKDRKLGRRRKSEMNQTMSLTLIVICSLTAFSGILVVAMCWYRLQKEVRLAQEMAYTACKGSRQHPCQRSAEQMSHYMQHYSAQKKHFQAQESSSEKKPCKQPSTDSEADGEEFAIYECPGLAPTGELEVHNPLFDPSRTKQ